MGRPKKKVEAEEPVLEDKVITPLQEAPTKDNRRIIRVCMHYGKSPLYHPFQQRWIPSDVDGVEVIDDSWLQCQIKGSLIKEVK